MKEFTNEKRTRYYGLRIGDIVRYADEEHVVINFHFMNNNNVWLRRKKDGYLGLAVAEHCEIITKVEDRK